MEYFEDQEIIEVDGISFRALRLNERELVKNKLIKYHIKNKKSWLEKYQPEMIEHILDQIYNDSLNFIINETFLVVFEVSQSWFDKNNRVLDERLILNLYPKNKGTFSDVCKSLNVLAKTNNCHKIYVGTAFTKNHYGLCKKFIKEGFEFEQISLIKNLEEV